MEKLLQLVAVFGLSLGAIFLRLVVLTKVWALVAVPMGAPQLDLLHAYGLTLICSLANERQHQKSDGELKTAIAAVANSIVGSLIVWLVTYLIFG
jgi:hypothetical protein